MRTRSRSKTWLVLFLAGAFLHAGVARAENFSRGDYIIPMDSVYQPYDLGSCAETDYGIFQAYGLVYKLLGEGVTVYWAINQSPSRVGTADPNYPDITLTGTAPLVELHTNSDTRGSTGLGAATTINYFGGPFIINVQNPTIKTKVDGVIAAWVANPANSRVNNCNPPAKHVSIHVAKADFSAPVARTMSGTPPRIAVLGAGATDILKGYLYIAGLGAASSGMYGVVTPEQIIAGALDKVGDEYPYQALWAPHWTGSGDRTRSGCETDARLFTHVVAALRRCRQPVPARVALADGRPVRVTTERTGFEGGGVRTCTGPWRTSGDWWTRSWNRDEWDVGLSTGVAYRIFHDRDRGGWFVDAVAD